MIAASRTLGREAAGTFIAFLLRKDLEFEVWMRRGISTKPGRVELMVAAYCKAFKIPITWWEPEPGGRDMVFFRDIAMVAEADLVLCLFHIKNPMDGGTAHVVEKAQDKTVPVYAYTYDPDERRLRRVGEHDPDDIWSGYVPRG